MDPSDAVEVWYCSYVLSWATIKQSLHLPCNCVHRKKSIFKLFQNPPLAKSLVQATGSCPWQELCLCQVAKLLRALAGNCRLLRPLVKIFRLMDFSALWVLPGPGHWEAKLRGSGECLASGEKDHIKIGSKGHICKMTTFQGTIFREWVTRTTVMLRSNVLPGRWLSPYTLNPDVLMFLKK